MKKLATAIFAIAVAASLLAAESVKTAPPVEPLAKAANGMDIPHPASTKTYPAKDGPRTVDVPEAMVYIPAGEFTYGAGPSAKKVTLDGYCIGKFSVTNAEYKTFLDATGYRGMPSYWAGGVYPAGKANHPVAFVSLTSAVAYCDWMSKATGWKIAIPTSEQWEKAARGPQGFLFPWGNSPDSSYANGVLTTKYNFNGVIAADCLKNKPKVEVTYDNNKSKYFGQKTTVDQISAFDDAGNATVLSISPNGSVRGWVSHNTYTGFIYTDLFTSLNHSGGNTTPVGSYEPGKSPYGCYDMAGNLWNWCDTKITATNGAEKGKTVNEIRGGSWYATGNSCKSISIGEGRAGAGAYNTVGFRVVMALGKP